MVFEPELQQEPESANPQLDNAVINNESEDEIVPQQPKITRNKAKMNFLEINEKQIISSSTNNINNNIIHHDDMEEGPPINYEHYQQVNCKRPQTSYGGISARQKSLQNSLRQMSSKNDDAQEKNKIEYNKNLGNPFDLRNKLTKMKNLFGN